MSPKSLELRRRRWTLVFSLPFTIFIIVTGLYSTFIAFVTEERLVAAIAGCGAFVAICVGGTFGKAVLEALSNLRPAVVLDSQGLNDLRGGLGLLPWHDIERLKLDVDEQRILLNFSNGAGLGSHPLISTTRRLFSGADYTVDLGGLHYNPRELRQALVAYHRLGRRDRVDDRLGNA